jgi:hypothetical protein
MPLVLPKRKLPTPAPPVKFKSETASERAVRVESIKKVARKMSNKDIAVAFLTILLMDSFKNADDIKLAKIVGAPLRGDRPDKVREFIIKYAEKYMRSGKKLLEKHDLADVLKISFVVESTPESAAASE